MTTISKQTDMNILLNNKKKHLEYEKKKLGDALVYIYKKKSKY